MNGQGARKMQAIMFQERHVRARPAGIGFAADQALGPLVIALGRAVDRQQRDADRHDSGPDDRKTAVNGS